MSRTAVAPPQPAAPTSLPGYELLERIGVGGYGEVWKARGPGGLLKAVKIVYGRADDERAVRELRSLSRLAEISHPYLLSLERVEVVDGQLFIVAELAESNLRSRFESDRASGLAGIPRDELLRYLRESAEALDFLYDRLSLQHLDVKPDNLLLLGDHVKVADFGMVKSVNDHAQSLVGGLTPLYAAPEVFDGRPSRYSDQYSLAIVYYELATGKLPFAGATVAQLASQHLHATPDLSHLEPRDRFAVGKALTKDAGRRFPSCKHFIDRLLSQRSSPAVLPTASAPNQANGTPGAAGAAPAPLHDGRTIVVSTPETTCLAPPQFDAQNVQFRPTIFIGVGGLAGEVLGRLKQMLNDQWSDAAGVPSLSMLYLDTDVQAVNNALKPSSGAPLSQDEVLLLPLDSTKAYRDKPAGQAPSLSRRWIYNIPKSRRTEGLRALGRLAFIDNSGPVLDRLRWVFSTASDAESLAASGAKTGLNFSDYNPRVFVVSSVSGGTGGGMVIDVAYAVRQVLAEMGLSDEDVNGVLAIPSPATAGGARLAFANAHACLEELSYFSAPHNHYPGEPVCRLAGFQESAGPFASTYVVDWIPSDQSDAPGATPQQMAKYLFLSSASKASAFFDACRRGKASLPDAVAVQSFGVSSLGEAPSLIPPEFIGALCQAAIESWQGGVDANNTRAPVALSQLDRLVGEKPEAAPVDGYIARLVGSKLAELHVTVDAACGRLHEAVERRLNRRRQVYCRELVEEALRRDASRDLAECWSHVTSVIDRVVGVESQKSSDAQNFRSLGETLRDDGATIAESWGQQLAPWALSLVDEPSTRVDGARSAVA
ncbi:MAG: protein kinase, partial [Planctomycetales bacterium]|nr:protein kinase [Planctomycetales bacterium]